MRVFYEEGMRHCKDIETFDKTDPRSRGKMGAFYKTDARHSRKKTTFYTTDARHRGENRQIS